MPHTLPRWGWVAVLYEDLRASTLLCSAQSRPVPPHLRSVSFPPCLSRDMHVPTLCTTMIHPCSLPKYSAVQICPASASASCAMNRVARIWTDWWSLDTILPSRIPPANPGKDCTRMRWWWLFEQHLLAKNWMSLKFRQELLISVQIEFAWVANVFCRRLALSELWSKTHKATTPFEEGEPSLVARSRLRSKDPIKLKWGKFWSELQPAVIS